MDIRAIAAMFSDYAVFGTDHPWEDIFTNALVKNYC